LEKSNKILFIGSIAIGDFTYLQACFRSLAQQYPNLKMDLWLDEYKGKSPILRWGYKKHDIVYDLIESSAIFNKVFKNVGAWWNMPKFFRQLRHEDYPIIVCLFNRRNSKRFAKKIASEGFIVKTMEPAEGLPVAESFAKTFANIFGIQVLNWQKPAAFIIDKHILDVTQMRLDQWNIKNGEKLIFINAFAKNFKRCWPIENVIELIKKMQGDVGYSDAKFILNSLPDKKTVIEKLIEKSLLRNVYVFTVERSFYELPAMVSMCNLVISVDTSVVHLAYAQGIPVIALMRQKNSHWAPPTPLNYVVLARRRSDYVKHITVNDVFEKVKTIDLTNQA
jgi:ADP-heptose:LPS heptosyltransferase